MANQQIQAPLPGVFYRSALPADADYKSEGDPIAVGDVIGLIEVMKSYHEVKSDIAGTLKSFLVENEAAIMAGQPLAEVET